jgi:hypothetical protein
MNGLMNRLSDQSKDSVVRSVKAIFDLNSLSVVRIVRPYDEVTVL